MIDSRQADVSLAFNTKPAIVRNTSNQKFVFISSALKAGAGPYTRTYKVEQGKDCEVQAEDFIRMRWEIERLVTAGKLSIVRGIASEIRTDDEYGNFYLKARPSDPVSTSLEDNMLWLIDTGNGNNLGSDVDVRVRLNGVTYSLFNSVASDSGYVLDFVSGDWTSAGDLWVLEVEHNLSANTVVTVYENDQVVWPHNVRKTDINTSEIYVPANPDLRFSGQIVLVKA